MAKCSIFIEWDSEGDELMVIRKLNEVSIEDVLDVLDQVKEDFLEAEWSEYVVS